MKEEIQKSYERNMKALGATNMKLDIIGKSMHWIETASLLRENIAGNKKMAKNNNFKLNNDFVKSIEKKGHKYLEFDN